MIEIFIYITSAEWTKLQKIILDFYTYTQYHADTVDILEFVDSFGYKKEQIFVN